MAPKPPVAFTRQLRARFIDLVGQGFCVRHAAAMVGVSAMSVYRQAQKDEQFKQEFDLARAAMAEKLIQESIRRAHDGWAEYVRDKDGQRVPRRDPLSGEIVMDELTGEVVYEVVTKYDSQLMQILLKGFADAFKDGPIVAIDNSQHGVIHMPRNVEYGEREWRKLMGLPPKSDAAPAVIDVTPVKEP